MLKIYLLTQSENNGWDTFPAIIVCAENEKDAKNIDPEGNPFNGKSPQWTGWATKKSNINCKEIGIANSDQVRGVILTHPIKG